MPASTFELISEKWENIEELKLNIIQACKIANLYYQILHEDEIMISQNQPSAKQLFLELRNSSVLEWYYSTYPTAKEEPEGRIPYFVFLNKYPSKKHYSIVLANNYLDYKLIYLFSEAYFKINKNHFISINGKKCINKEQFEKIPHYLDGWWNNLEEYFIITNYNI